MAKKISIATKPIAKPIDADNWVTASSNNNQTTQTNQNVEPVQILEPPAPQIPEKAKTEPTTRFTIDIPVSLHRLIKSDCALRGVKMNEEIRNLLENHFLKHN